MQKAANGNYASQDALALLCGCFQRQQSQIIHIDFGCRKSATEGVSQQRDSKAEGGTDVTRPRGLTHLSIESTNPGIEQENSDRSSSVIDLSSDSDGNDCELLTEDRRDTDSRC